MKRTLIALMAVTFAAASANALATVDVTFTGTPTPGSTITLEVRVTGTPADGTDGSLFGALVYPTSGIVTPVTPGTQFAFPSDGTPYGLGALSCTTARCVMFNQVAGVQGPQTGSQTNFLIASQNYTIAPGAIPGSILTWNWQTTPSTQILSFYNATPVTPALSVTVVPIPEPTTAAMLGLGLFGLAMAGRRRA